MGSRVVKKRYWGAILYPESAPEDWQKRLSQTGLPVAVSPLHDRDKKDDGSLKKPHWHIIMAYSGPMSYNAVKDTLDRLELQGTIPKALDSLRGAYEYLTHANNPDKAQYSKEDIVSINGFKISEYVDMTKAEQLELQLKIFDLVEANDFLEYCDLLMYLRNNKLMEEFNYACSHTIMFNSYISSRRHKVKGDPIDGR